MFKPLFRMTALVGLAAAAPTLAQYTYWTPERSNYGEINITGATLFDSFYRTLQSTNDYINPDGDLACGAPRSGFFDSDCDGTRDSIDQLARSFNCGGFTSFWAINAREVGSGNGLAELRDFTLCGVLPTTPPNDYGWFNRTKYAENGAAFSLGCGAANATGSPEVQHSIDAAVMDVPVAWFVTKGITTDANWQRKPDTDGYGMNPQSSYTTAMTPAGGYSNALKNKCTNVCGGGSLCLNTDTTYPQPANTVFDRNAAWVPIAIIANRGVGIDTLRYSEMQYLWSTGRLPNGMNLKACTRDAGSGTRNGCMNSIGLDPSWGRGDNMGSQKTADADTKLGAITQWTNLGGSGVMEKAVQNHTLAVGYSGLSGSSRAAADAVSGNYEILSVIKDIGVQPCSTSAPIRPLRINIIDNADPCTGYQIGGPETFATIGDPNANRAASDPRKTNNLPMANQAAADYLNNVMDSIEEFAIDPTTEEQYFMPGEWMAKTFFLPAGVEAQPSMSDPSSFDMTVNRNLTLRQYMIDHNNLEGPGEPPAYGLKCAGKVPERAAGTYTDGTGDGRYFFKTSPTNTLSISAGKTLSQRNRLAGDFLYDGQRNLSDVPEMMRAVHQQLDFDYSNHGGCYDGSVPSNGDYTIVTVLGDFTGDGNFNADDIRYFADGLAIDPQTGKLDRKQAFIDVDTAWSNAPFAQGNNYFGTTLATCKSYANGDSRGDITGNAAYSPAAGTIPQGSDGIVDLVDVEYVKSNIGDWANLDDAVHMDLSADMNGDLNVTAADVVEIVEVILGTKMGDLNLDGAVDAIDQSIQAANLGAGPGKTYAQGDLDCDGDVDAADQAILNANLGFTIVSMDFNHDCEVDGDDLLVFAECASGPSVPLSNPSVCLAADADHDGDVDQVDFASFQRSLTRQTPPPAANSNE